jgi:hypothetical protein
VLPAAVSVLSICMGLFGALAEPGPDQAGDESGKRSQQRETSPEEECHYSTFVKSRNTMSARPIRALSGSGVSTPFSRFAPSRSSYPRGT